MSDEQDERTAKDQLTVLDVATPLPSETQANEPGSIEIHRETRETIVRKQVREVREVVRYQPPSSSISLDKLSEPAVGQALLDERNFWRDLAAEREESIVTLQQQLRGLTATNHKLDKRSALAENDLGSARRTAWLEGLFIAIGGILCGVGFAPPYNWPFASLGLLMILAAAISGLQRSRAAGREGPR